MHIKAKLFPSNASSMEEIQVSIYGKYLRILKENGSDQFLLSKCNFDAPMPNCPLVIELPDGSRIESISRDIDPQFVDLLLPNRSKAVLFLETHKVGILVSVISTIAFLYWAVSFGIPMASQTVAKFVPQTAANKLDVAILKSIEEKYLKESEIPIERQQYLTEYFQKHTDHKVNLRFHKMGVANAFALAGETVIFTDEIVNLLENEKHLLAIYLHEVGHLKERHVVSQMISAATLSVLSFLVIGDMSGMQETIATVGYSLMTLKYSRRYEEQADYQSAIGLMENNLPVSCFEDGLGALVEHYKEKYAYNEDKKSVFDYLSTHPKSKERFKLLRDQFPLGFQECK